MLGAPFAGDAPILPWQTDQWQALRAQIDTGKLAHALLIAGTAGIGKLQFALAARDFLLCEQPAEFACGKCKSCVLLRAHTHADFVTLEPEAPGKAIRVDQVRNLSEFVAQTAQRNGRKVVLLNPADALNINAANALLKSLEEPSADTHFLLLSAAPKRLPATVRSRCQTLTLPAPPPELALDWLGNQLDDAADAQRRLRLMRNQPCAALLADEELLQARQAVSDGLVNALQSRAALLVVAEQWAKLPLQLVFESLANHLADAARFALAPTADAASESDKPDVGAYISQHVPMASLFAAYTAVQDMLKKLHHGGNPNKQLAVEGVLMALCANKAQVGESANM